MSDITCNDNIFCDSEKPDYKFRLYLAAFINWFVNRTFTEVGITYPLKNILLFKVEVFKLYAKNETNGVFLGLIKSFNKYMQDNATTLYTNNMSIYNIALFPNPPQLLSGQDVSYYINGVPNGELIDTKRINLVIAAYIINKILSESSEVGPAIPPILVSQLKTYMTLLPNNHHLNVDYLQTLHDNPDHPTSAALLGKTAEPLQAEIILHAANYMTYKGGSHTIRDALSRYPGLAIEDVRLPVSSLPPYHPLPNGGAKKRNKSKRRNQKKSNKKSRRHRNRKRLSRHNAKRFY
jgi:hypothetical protein